MNQSFQQLFESSPAGAIAALALAFLFYMIAGLAPLFGAIYLLYFLLTLPMRRNERARFFLDILELGMKEGRTPESAIVEASRSRDPALGARFHLLASHLERGLRLGLGLELVPRLLPPELQGMLRVGEQVGDVRKVLPACRQMLEDGVSQVRGALNYLLLVTFVVTPFTAAVPFILRIKVIPAFKAIYEGMLEGMPLPRLTQIVFEQSGWILAIQLAVFVLVWMAMIAYVGGPRLRRWFDRQMPGLLDRLLYRLPWRRKRLQRNFSAMLAVLLDAGVPEAEAITLAGDATANRVLRSRAQRVRVLLTEGVKLPEAIRVMDHSGELGWRLANALRRGSGFTQALIGWHGALNAKAFQLEQAAAQIATTGLVLLNGAIVACVVIGMFLVIIRLINQAVLW
jgi:type II secretory pathway component PulF